MKVVFKEIVQKFKLKFSETQKLPDGEVILQTKTITPTKEQQSVTADDPYTALGKVVVQPIPNEYIIPKGKVTIAENGEWDIKKYETAIVNVKGALLTAETDSELESYNTESNLGKIIQFIGESEKYVTNAYYLIEEEQEVEIIKLDTPQIRLDIVQEIIQLAKPSIRLEIEEDEEIGTTAVLGEAVLGYAVLGRVNDEPIKLQTPSIRLEIEEDEVIKLATPLIRIEIEQELIKLATPQINLIEEIELIKLDKPLIRLEEEIELIKLDKPIIRLEEEIEIIKLDKPIIRLDVEIEKLLTPTIRLDVEIEKLSTPVIRLDVEIEKLTTPSIYLVTELEQLEAPTEEILEV